MFIIGQDMHKNHELNNNMIVSTVMSNLGFIKLLKQKAFNQIKQKLEIDMSLKK